MIDIVDLNPLLLRGALALGNPSLASCEMQVL